MAAKDRDLQPQEIDALLQELGNELMKRGFTSPVRVLILGGAYMALIAGTRRTTQDVDIFPLNFPDSSKPNEITHSVLTAIRAVARRNKLKREWFNDSAFGILGELQPAAEQLRSWKTYGALEIYAPPDEFILMTKIIGYRDKDYNDVKALLDRLSITERAQVQTIMDAYVDQETQKEYLVEETLDNFFDE